MAQDSKKTRDRLQDPITISESVSVCSVSSIPAQSGLRATRRQVTAPPTDLHDVLNNTVKADVLLSCGCETGHRYGEAGYLLERSHEHLTT